MLLILLLLSGFEAAVTDAHHRRTHPQLNSVDLTMRAPKVSQALVISLSSPYLAKQITRFQFAVHRLARQV